MAPDLAILKRKRSRPSDWWAAPPTSAATPPPQQDEPARKQRGQPSTSDLTGRVIQEAPAAVNRGRVAKSHDGPSAEHGKIAGKLRRGRSLNTEDELQASAEKAPEIEATRNKKKNKKAGQHAAGQLVEGTTVDLPAQTQTSRKRGRSTADAREQVVIPAPTKVDSQTAQKKRGRPPASHTKEQPAVEPPAEAGSRNAQRRGRSSNLQGEIETAVEGPSKSQSRPTKRKRPPNTETEAIGASSTEGNVTNKRRTRQSDAGIAGPSSTKPLVKDVGRLTAREGRHSNTVLEVQTATSAFSRKRKARKNDNDAPTATADRVPSNNAAPDKPRKRGKEIDTGVLEKSTKAPVQGKRSRTSRNIQQGEDGREESEGLKDQEHGKKRRRAEKPVQEDDHEASEPEMPLTYQHLAPVTRRVSRQIIEAKWEPLPPSCIELVSQLLNDMQRPVVVRLNDERKRTQASTALQMVSRRLVTKISKGLPFPQGTRNRREDDFDFEKILNHNRDLEAQLTPILHANELLDSELKKEAARLEVEKEALLELETNAKTEATRRKEAGRKVHSLLQSGDSVTTEDGLKDRIGFAVGSNHLPLSLEDEDLQAVVKELQGHVGSIQSNIDQVKGIAHAMSKSKAAVQATLFDHLEKPQYEDVVLG